MADLHVAALGQAVAVEVRGAAAAPTAVLVHGLTGDRALLIAAFDEVLAAAGLRRVYLDLPGHGASAKNAAAASADALVDALAVVLGEIGGPAPLLIGHSYGAYLIQGLLGSRDCAGALLLCPVVEPEFARRIRPPRRIVRRDPGLAFGDDLQEQVTFEEVAVVQTREVLAAYRQLVLPASRAVDRDFVEAVRARYAMARPYLASLGRCGAPVSIVCGRDDHWVGYEDAARLLRALPDAELEVVAGCGSLLPLEQPARLRAAVDTWLARAQKRA